MAAIERKTKRCPTDPTDEWRRIAPLLPKPARRGRKRDAELREVLNAIRFMAPVRLASNGGMVVRSVALTEALRVVPVCADRLG